MNTLSFEITGVNYSHIYPHLPNLLYIVFSHDHQYVALGYPDYFTHLLRYTENNDLILRIFQDATITKIVTDERYTHGLLLPSVTNVVTITSYLLDHDGINVIPNVKSKLRELTTDNLQHLSQVIDMLKYYVETYESCEPKPLVDSADKYRQDVFSILTIINSLLAGHLPMKIARLISLLKMYPESNSVDIYETILLLINEKFLQVNRGYITLH